MIPETDNSVFRSRIVVRVFWCGLGWIALAFGVIGLLLPLLPTTPFLILAAFAYSKGSERLHRALCGHRHFGPIILTWKAEGAIAPRYKLVAIGMMGGAFVASIAFSVGWMVLIIQTIFIGVAALFVLSRPNAMASHDMESLRF